MASGAEHIMGAQARGMYERLMRTLRANGCDDRWDFREGSRIGGRPHSLDRIERGHTGVDARIHLGYTYREAYDAMHVAAQLLERVRETRQENLPDEVAEKPADG